MAVSRDHGVSALSEKIRKKDIQAAKAPDAVLVNATSLFEWIVQRRYLLLGALAVIIVVVSVASFVGGQKDDKRQDVGAKLSAAMALTSRPVIEGATGKDTFPSAEAKSKAVQAELEAVLKEGANTPAAEAASLALARLDLEAGQTDAAIAKFEAYLGSVKKGGLRLFALEGLGYAYEAKGDKAKASSTFAELKDAGAPALALYHQARMAQESGNKDEARKLFEQVVADYDKEPVAGDARARLELLDVPPAGQGAFEKAEPVEAPVEKKKGK